MLTNLLAKYGETSTEESARKICPQILPKSWRFPGFLTGNMAIFFENFPKSSLEHVAWDVNFCFCFFLVFWV